MSDIAAPKSRNPAGVTSHPALSRKATRKPRLPQASESSVVKAFTSDASSVVTTSTNARHLQVNTHYENTYKMLPDEDKRFTGGASVSGAVHSILESYLCDVDYEEEKCSSLSKDLAHMIKQRIRDMNFDRYKLLVTVMIGENTGQGLQTATRFLWNTQTDNFLSVNYKNGTLFAVATIYAIYYE